MRQARRRLLPPWRANAWVLLQGLCQSGGSPVVALEEASDALPCGGTTASPSLACHVLGFSRGPPTRGLGRRGTGGASGVPRRRAAAIALWCGPGPRREDGAGDAPVPADPRSSGRGGRGGVAALLPATGPARLPYGAVVSRLGPLSPPDRAPAHARPPPGPRQPDPTRGRSPPAAWCGSASCRALPSQHRWGRTATRDDTRTHEPLATGRPPLGVSLPTLGTQRLPHALLVRSLLWEGEGARANGHGRRVRGAVPRPGLDVSYAARAEAVSRLSD
jgi:hypothetical protein